MDRTAIKDTVDQALYALDHMATLASELKKFAGLYPATPEMLQLIDNLSKRIDYEHVFYLRVVVPVRDAEQKEDVC